MAKRHDELKHFMLQILHHSGLNSLVAWRNFLVPDIYQTAETQTSRGLIKKAADFFWNVKDKLFEAIKAAPLDENLKELQTIVTNQRCLLDWFRQEEQSFIDLKEIGEIANKYTNSNCIVEPQSYEAFNSDPHAIENMNFLGLISNLRLGISYFDLILKRYESLIEAFQIYQYKAEEYQKARIQGEPLDANEKEKRKELLLYIDNTKRNLNSERDMITHICKSDLAMVLENLQIVLERLNTHIQTN